MHESGVGPQAKTLARLLGHDPDNLPGEALPLFYKHLVELYPFAYPFVFEYARSCEDDEAEYLLKKVGNTYSHIPHYALHEARFWQLRGYQAKAIACSIVSLGQTIGDFEQAMDIITEASPAVSKILRNKLNLSDFIARRNFKALRTRCRQYLARNETTFAVRQLRACVATFRHHVKTIMIKWRRRKRKEESHSTEPSRIKLWVKHVLMGCLNNAVNGGSAFTRYFYSILYVLPLKIRAQKEIEGTLFPQTDAYVKHGEKQTIYVIHVVWGKKYIEAMKNSSLATQLASKNLPKLSQQYDVKYVFYVTENDIEPMQRDSVVNALMEYAGVAYIPIDNALSAHAETPFLTMTACHNHVLASLAGRSDFIIFSSPDALFADGAFERMGKLIKEEYTYIFCSGNLRLNQERVTALLASARTNGVLSFSPREMVRLAVANMHPASYGFLAEGDIHSACPTGLFWRVGDEGLILHSMHLHPVMLRAPSNIVTVKQSIDGDLLLQDESKDIKIYIVPDTDELVLFSTTPEDELADWNLPGPYTETIIARALLERADVFHRAFWLRQCRFHLEDESQDWQAAAEKAQRFAAAALEATLERNDRDRRLLNQASA